MTLTDDSPGELEETILQSFIRGAKLRSWLSQPDCPPSIKECHALFEKHIDHEPASSFVTSSTAISKQPVPHDLTSLIPHSHATFRANYRLGGVVYSRYATHTGNSLVMFYPSNSAVMTPGCIKYIFEVDGCTRFAIQRQLPANPHTLDPYQHYPYFPARLYSRDLDPNLELVNVVNVVSHFARWQFSEEYVVVLTLMKVR